MLESHCISSGPSFQLHLDLFKDAKDLRAREIPLVSTGYMAQTFSKHNGMVVRSRRSHKDHVRAQPQKMRDGPFVEGQWALGARERERGVEPAPVPSRWRIV